MTRLLAAIVILIASLAPALAENLDATDPFVVRDALRDAGFRARMQTDGAGQPMIVSSLRGQNFRFYFYGCSDSVGCTSVQLSATFTLAGRRAQQLQLVNDWNLSKRFAYAALNETGLAFLRLDINMDQGVSRENFVDTLDLWDLLLTDFIAFTAALD